MSLFSRLTTRTQPVRGRGNRYTLAERSAVTPDTESVDEKVTKFGTGFVAAMRRSTAQDPKSLRIHDVVDVFSDKGEFLYRGLVESRDEACAQVRVGQPSSSGGEAEPVTYRVKIENCRYADASPPPATLDEWEAARSVDSSEPPL